MSSSLQSDYEKLVKEGWSFKYGDATKGSYTLKDQKTVVIGGATEDTPSLVVQLLSHEIGHADYKGTVDSTTLPNFLQSTLADEGAATLNNIAV